MGDAAGGEPGRDRRPPGPLFHLILLGPIVVVLHANSTTAYSLPLLMASTLGLGLGAILWCIRAARCAFSRQRPRVDGRAAWFVVAPVCAALWLVALAADLPLHARWSLARDDFNKALELAPETSTAPADPAAPDSMEDAVFFDVPNRLGTYTVNRASRIPSGVFFHLGGSDFGSIDGGFAHLPDGPSDDLGPGALGLDGFMLFRHVDADWYRWEVVVSP